MKINTVIFTGHLGRDPEEVQTASRTLTKGRLAVGQGREKPTIWLDLACWSKYASEDLLKARKGDCVTVSGRLTLREWTDKASGSGHLLRDCRGPRRPRRSRYGSQRAAYTVSAERRQRHARS